MLHNERRWIADGRPVSKMFSTRGALEMVAASLLAAVLLTGCTGGGMNDQPLSGDTFQPSAGGAATAIVGVVTDESGNPLAEVGIGVVKGTSGVPEILELTADDGSYMWGVPAGTYTLMARKDGYEELSQEVTVKEGEQAVLDFTLKKLP